MDYLQDLRYKGLQLLQYLIIIFSVAATLRAIISNEGFLIAIADIIPGFIMLILIIFQRVKVNARNLIRILTVAALNLIIIPVLWFHSPGINSAIPLYSLVSIILSAFFAKKLVEFLFPVAGLAYSIFMIRYVLINPAFFTQVPDKDILIYSYMFHFFIIALVMMVGIFFINQSFEKDQDKFFRLSITDELTGLYNRMYFFKCGIEAFEDFIRYSTKFTVLMIDLDSLKTVNDLYGHAAGDLVLKEFANILSNTLRTVDIAARIDGEEFAIILKNTDLRQTAVVAERIRESLEQTEIEFKKEQFSITCSIGGHQASSMSNSFDDVLFESEKKMLIAKENGKNRVSLKL
ncbi:diguanylate cyclase [Eubacteriaceae bacterium ES2]|nr:diguanylate cyclase [Eubacteriaceae bacterium ES2]